MEKWRIFDVAFQHAKYSTDYQESKYITWTRDGDYPFRFYTDTSLTRAYPNVSSNIAWLLEPMAINNTSYEWIKNHSDRFDIIFTHDKSMLDISDKYKFLPMGGCWIEPSEQMIYDKSKNISIIASDKKSTVGHKLRHVIVDKFRDKISTYGRGYKVLEHKIEGLRDYRFSIAIENSKKDYYFTEKLIDCFMTGTIPIYYGCPSIGDFFNINGMILINDENDLADVIDNLTEEKYLEMLPYVKDNFEKAKQFMIAEDYIYENYNDVIKNSK